MKTAHTPVSSSKPTFVWIAKETSLDLAAAPINLLRPRFAPLGRLRQWLNAIEIHDAATANVLCRLIPARCPFARTIKLFDRTLFSIPPLCKLNPCYEEVVGLRFRALCYLADECSEDISRYC